MGGTSRDDLEKMSLVLLRPRDEAPRRHTVMVAIVMGIGIKMTIIIIMITVVQIMIAVVQ